MKTADAEAETYPAQPSIQRGPLGREERPQSSDVSLQVYQLPVADGLSELYSKISSLVYNLATEHIDPPS